MNSIKRAWRGEAKLWKVFWLYGILLSAVVALSAPLSMMFLYDKILPLTSLWMGLNLLYPIYILWISIALWRCAFNVRWRSWGYVARALIPVMIIVNILFMMGMTLAVNKAQSIGPCRQEANVFAAGIGLDKGTYLKKCMQREEKETDGKTLNPTVPVAVFRQLSACWNAPKEALDSDNAVILDTKWAMDGSLVKMKVIEDNGRYDSDTLFRRIADSAMDAVRRCEPLKKMPAGNFTQWQNMVIKFDLRTQAKTGKNP